MSAASPTRSECQLLSCTMTPTLSGIEGEQTYVFVAVCVQPNAFNRMCM